MGRRRVVLDPGSRPLSGRVLKVSFLLQFVKWLPGHAPFAGTMS
jgi:hypothetical protein